jgi:ATP/maltotriose-dependent transcriptional regulator MalT
MVQRLRPGDDEAWLSWLAAQTACAFKGHSGRLNVHNEAREAIAHALAARDFAYAAALIEREAGHLWLSGEAQTVQSWIGALPDFVVRRHARLALNTALRLLECMYAAARESYARAQAQVEQTIARVEAVLKRQRESTAGPEAEETLPALPEAEVALIERRIGLLRALIAARASLRRGDAARMRLLAEETKALSEPEELSWKLIALWIAVWLIDTLQCEGALLIGRLLEAKQQYAQALAALSGFSAELDRPGDTDTTIHFLALQVVALRCGGQNAQARAVAARLLALTEPEGYILVYLDAGEPMHQLLQSLLDPPYDQENGLPPASVAFVTKLLAAFPKDEGGRMKDEEHSTRFHRSSFIPQPLVEPLTPREQQVLRLLLAGASNQEIASELVISLATVKKHVSNLLGKLGLASRTQAIARAREWSHLA